MVRGGWPHSAQRQDNALEEEGEEEEEYGEEEAAGPEGGHQAILTGMD